jgi:hypothetical protein
MTYDPIEHVLLALDPLTSALFAFALPNLQLVHPLESYVVSPEHGGDMYCPFEQPEHRVHVAVFDAGLLTRMHRFRR